MDLAGAAAGELGVLAEQVTDIFISHAHFDQMGGIGEFPNAMIYMQKREYIFLLEAMALPPRFGFLTAAVSADDLRCAGCLRFYYAVYLA